jgi:hypothetical protein
MCSEVPFIILYDTDTQCFGLYNFQHDNYDGVHYPFNNQIYSLSILLQRFQNKIRNRWSNCATILRFVIHRQLNMLSIFLGPNVILFTWNMPKRLFHCRKFHREHKYSDRDSCSLLSKVDDSLLARAIRKIRLCRLSRESDGALQGLRCNKLTWIPPIFHNTALHLEYSIS